MPQFDPYLEWLGIRPEERPLSYYRLLGISDFEANANVIEMAVKKRIDQLRSFLNGDKRRLAEEVIKNIAKARDCLLNAQQKEQYDKKLKATLSPAQRVANPQSGVRANLLSDEASKVSSSKWMMVPAVVAVVTVIIVVVSLIQPEEGKQVSTTTPQEPSESSPADSTTTDPADSTTTDPADSTTTDPADSTTTDPAEVTTTSSNTPPVNWVKRAIPPIDERVAAVARWENFFKEQIAGAQGRLDKAALAGKIFQKSKDYVLTDPDTNWAELFAVLQFSYIMARDSGSKVQTDIIRERLGEIFSVDVLELRLDECQVWEKSVVRYLTTPHVAGFVNLTGPTLYKGESLPVLYEEIAVQAESLQRYDIAADSYEGLVRLADTITELKGRVAAWKTGKARAVVAQQRFVDHRKAVELLKQNPQDPAANRDAGIYLAFVRGNWNEGCRYLAKGAAEPLAGLAKLELRRLNPVVPNSVSAMQSLGDGWADYGQREAEPVDRRPVYRHASNWYERAIKVTNSPLDKSELEKKITTLSKLDVNVGVAASEVVASEVAASEVPPDKGTQKIILQAGLLNNDWQVLLPNGVTSDNCSLEIKFVSFPPGTKFSKAGSIAKRGKEVTMETTGPSAVKFKIGIVAAKSDENVANTKQLTIRLHTTFKKTRLSTKRPQLSMAELQKAIMGQENSLNSSLRKIAALEKQAAGFAAEAARVGGDARKRLQLLKMNCEGLILREENKIEGTYKVYIKGWQTLQRDLESIFGKAEIHCKIVPTP